jgi:hypothetical protein
MRLVGETCSGPLQGRGGFSLSLGSVAEYLGAGVEARLGLE